MVTNPATSVTTTGGVLNGGVNPNGLATNGWFEWGTSPTLASFSSTSTQSMGSGTTSQAVSATLSGLTPGTPYYFRAAASNSSGTSKGSIASFSTMPAAVAPTVVTNPATSVTTTGGVLNGGVNPNGLSTNGWFEWGTSPTLATFSSTPSQSLGSGTTSQAIVATLSGLTPGTPYYFRVAASNSSGTSKGSIASFSTLPAAVAPTVVTNPATSVTTTGGVLNGGVNPNGLSTNGWFEWGTSPTLATFSSTSTQSLGSGTTSQAVSATLSGLTPGTPYYFRVAASNSSGTSKGSIASFSPSAPGGFLEDGTGLVSMESEHYQTNTPLGGYAWTPVANAGYSGTGALRILPDDGPDPLPAGSGPRLDYQVQFARTGTHYVWIRALGYSGASDSLYVGLDGGTSSAVYMAGLAIDGLTWTWSRQAGTGPIATVNVPSVGVHTVNVWMRESGVVLDKLVLNSSSSYVPTGTGPAETVSSEYVAVGDSITAGSHDDIPADGIGYEPVLGTMLTAAKGYPISVANEGISGTTSADGLLSISTVLAKYPTAKYYLVMYGTNDAVIPAVPSGSGLLPGDPGYNGSYKDNMQRIISAILAAGKTPYLAEVPYTTDPLRSIAIIYEYNAAVDELVLTNNILVTPPPFYAYFLAHPGELADGIHPNGTGYQSMGNLWFSALPK